METYQRKEPHFSLCGLNCCLCPRFHTDGDSRCPGCGGEGFSEKHPTCAVVTCSKKHGNRNVEFCYQCAEYPCQKYQTDGAKDSFISYKNVLKNMGDAQLDLQKYLEILRKKYQYLKILLDSYNDGKSKGLYCLAVNLLPINEIKDIFSEIDKFSKNKAVGQKEMAKEVARLMAEKARELNIDLKLRK